jgi:hypothetical protein
MPANAKKKTLETAWLPFSKVYPKQLVFLPVHSRIRIPEMQILCKPMIGQILILYIDMLQAI